MQRRSCDCAPGTPRAGGTKVHGGRSCSPTFLAEQRHAGDGFQRPLVPRFRFQPRLMPSVDMASDVKGWEQLFLRLHPGFPLSIGRAGARKTRRLLTLLSVDWLPPSWPPSGACLMQGTSVPCGRCTRPRVTPHRGCVSADGREHSRELVRQPAALLRLAMAQQSGGPSPTERHAMPGPWRRRLDGHVCLWPSAGEPVCRAGPGPSS